MKKLNKRLKLTTSTCAFLYLVACVVYGWLPSPISEEASVFMPGSQPDASASTLESVESCNNCHAGFDAPTNPYHGWQGSMMAHAARDPLWIASLAVANQDAIWALGNGENHSGKHGESGDLSVTDEIRNEFSFDLVRQ